MNYPEMNQLKKKTIAKTVAEIRQLPVDREMAKREPNGLAEIKALRHRDHGESGDSLTRASIWSG
jgi:hypothetical protein